MSHLEQTLAWVNGVRAGLGLEPIDEFPRDDLIQTNRRSRTCPIARALEVPASVSSYGIALNPDDFTPITIRTPKFVAAAIRDFDDKRDELRVLAGRVAEFGYTLVPKED